VKASDAGTPPPGPLHPSAFAPQSPDVEAAQAEAPLEGCEAPQEGYEAPQEGYKVPQEGYEAPEEGVAAIGGGEDERVGPGDAGAVGGAQREAPTAGDSAALATAVMASFPSNPLAEKDVDLEAVPSVYPPPTHTHNPTPPPLPACLPCLPTHIPHSFSGQCVCLSW